MASSAGRSATHGSGRLARLRVVGQDVADASVVEIHLDGIDRRQRSLRRRDRPAGPPSDVVARARPEGPQPAPDELGPRVVDRHPPIPSGSQRSIGLQRNWLPIQVPRGRPRPILPSSARWKKTFWETLIVASHRVPGARVSFWPRRGSSALSSAVVASPRSRTAASPAASSSSSRAAGSGPMPASGEHSDGPLALGLRDRPRRGRVDHGHVGDRHQEERPAHREDAQDGPFLVHLALDGGR